MFCFPMMVYAYQFDTQKLSNVKRLYYPHESPCCQMPVDYARSEPFVICGRLLQSYPPTAPLFSFSDWGQVRCLEYRVFVDHVWQLVASCGLNPGDYSGHSFWRGGCTWAWQPGASPQIIMSQGDWQSCSWMTSVDIPFTSQWQVARLMSNSLRNYILWEIVGWTMFLSKFLKVESRGLTKSYFLAYISSLDLIIHG